MNRRRRALAFGCAALACGVLAAILASGYRSAATAQLGDLRPVLVAGAELPAGRPIGPGVARRDLQVRRIPARFVPAGALQDPTEALGLEPQATIPAGSYVLGAQLEAPELAGQPSLGAVGRGRQPVEIAVSGAGALAVGGAAEGSRVDVVVSEQPQPGAPGRTYIAASAVRLLSLSGPEGPGTDGAWTATLALTRNQALRLIAAEGFAREVRLLPRG